MWRKLNLVQLAQRLPALTIRLKAHVLRALSIQKFNLLKKPNTLVQKLYIANAKGGRVGVGVCRMWHKLQLAVVRGTFRMLSTKFIYKSRNVTQAGTHEIFSRTNLSIAAAAAIAIAIASTHRANPPSQQQPSSHPTIQQPPTGEAGSRSRAFI